MLTHWYIPSWNGDIRVEAAISDPRNRSTIKIIKPTAGELHKLEMLSKAFREKGWVNHDLWDPKGSIEEQVVPIEASILDVAPYLVTSYKPGKATLTAIKYADGHVEAVEAGNGFWAALKNMLTEDDAKDTRVLQERDDDIEHIVGPDREKREAEAERKAENKFKADEKKRKEEAKAKAVTSKRPTVCCPVCVAGDLTPAGEVLFEFLDEDEKDQWKHDHSIVVTGGITGHRYLLSHRHGKWAQKHGKICHDLDNGHTLHFHDHSVPPEEEVLAAKHILEHREYWLRVPGAACGDLIFESPFGDGGDGMRSTSFNYQLGDFFAEIEQLFEGKDPEKRIARCTYVGGSSPAAPVAAPVYGETEPGESYVLIFTNQGPTHRAYVPASWAP